MKRNILHILWAAAVIPLALASCRQEVVSGETDGSDAQPFLITVTDGGYASETTAGMTTAGSRATENGYITTFTAGDRCGLYIVRGGEIVYDNICLTATADADGNLTWQAPEGTNLGGGLPDEYYFLYYPYQTGMTDKVTVAAAASDDAAFFVPLINGWQPKADQSDYTDYTASDLMTASGTITTNADGTLLLSFRMAHRMAMAVIEMPEMVYKFTNLPTVPDYTIAASADFSSENKPYLMSDGSYRFLVNPVAQEGATLTGSYDNGNKVFTITPSIVTTGNYKTYKVDGGYKEITHTLQAGDFYLKDGTLLSKDAVLTDAQKAACVGIVFWVGDATATDPALEKDFPQCTHGLVVSLKETESVWQSNYDSQSSIQSWAEPQEFYKQGGYYALNKDVVFGTESPGDIQGYNNTQILKAYDEAFASYPVTILNSFGAITEGVILPEDKTSGWYLPSPRELVELHYAIEAVNQSLTAFGSNPQLSLSKDWSSGEDSYNCAWLVNLYNGLVNSYPKAGGYYYVRLAFAF